MAGRVESHRAQAFAECFTSPLPPKAWEEYFHFAGEKTGSPKFKERASIHFGKTPKSDSVPRQGHWRPAPGCMTPAAPLELATRGCPGSRYLLLGILVSKLWGKGRVLGEEDTPAQRWGGHCLYTRPEERDSGQKEARGAPPGLVWAPTPLRLPVPKEGGVWGTEGALGYLPSLLPEKQAFPRCAPAFRKGQAGWVTVRAGQTGTGFRERRGGPAARGAL